MIRCEVCGRENDDAFKFCLDCGTSLSGQAEARPQRRPPIQLTEPAPPTGLQPMAQARTAPVEPGAAAPAAPSPEAPAPAPSTAATEASASDAALCAQCGTPLFPGHVFCGSCGARVQAAPPADGGTAFMHAGDAARLAPARYKLVVIRADGSEGARFELSGGRAVAGRAEADIVLDDPHLSDRHTAFDLKDGDLVVSDLGTPNGTYLKVAPGEKVRAGDGTVLRLGRQLLTLEAVAPERPDPDGQRVWGSPDPGYVLRVVQHLEEGGVGNVWPLAEGTWQLGREAGDLTFPGDGFVSGRHARITVGPAGRGTFEDTGSSNGSFVRLTQETRLRAGDMLLLGSHLLRVEAG